MNLQKSRETRKKLSRSDNDVEAEVAEGRVTRSSCTFSMATVKQKSDLLL